MAEPSEGVTPCVALHRGVRPSNRSDEICSEISPTRKITTLRRMSSTDEFVTCDCVAIVHAA